MTARRIGLWVLGLCLCIGQRGEAQEQYLPPDQVLPQRVFMARREAFLSALEEGAVAILPSATIKVRNGDQDYPFRQDSDFYYLTGFEEPGAIAILRHTPSGGQQYTLLVRPRDRAREIWTGLRHGVEGAMRLFGADTAFTISQADSLLPRYLQQASKVYYAFGGDEELDAKVQRWFAQLGDQGPLALANARPLVHERRLLKSPEELSLLQRAIDITAEAHLAAMRAMATGMNESVIDATISYIFRRHGVVRPGFLAIVGSGPNSTILHYASNTREMRSGEVVVVDIGAEYGFYTADVTRTLPVSGRFTPAQRAIYELVLEAQSQAIDLIKPGVSYREVHNRAVEVVTAGLARLGLLKGEVRGLIDSQAYRKFFMHGTTHWLGIDVHDVGRSRVNGEWRELEPGMVLTVEPGIYIAEGTEGVDPKYWNIGVRIEDDVLVTPSGHQLLSGRAPRSVEEVERMMAQRPVDLTNYLPYWERE